MAVLRLFASVRQMAGTGRVELTGATVGQVVGAAVEKFGPEFAAQAERCRIWRNGEPADLSTPVGPDDEVALLPPVSGG